MTDFVCLQDLSNGRAHTAHAGISATASIPERLEPVVWLKAFGAVARTAKANSHNFMAFNVWSFPIEECWTYG